MPLKTTIVLNAIVGGVSQKYSFKNSFDISLFPCSSLGTDSLFNKRSHFSWGFHYVYKGSKQIENMKTAFHITRFVDD